MTVQKEDQPRRQVLVDNLPDMKRLNIHGHYLNSTLRNGKVLLAETLP